MQRRKSENYVILCIVVMSCFTVGVLSLPQSSINEKIILQKGSDAFEWWSKPSTEETTVKIFIFSITNIDEFLEGNKAKLTELGPYVYKVKVDRQDINEFENGTLRFKNKKIYEFVEHESKGSEFDSIFVPNIPMFGAIAKVKDQGAFPILATADLFKKTQTELFVEMTVKEFLWGFEYPLLQVAKGQGNRDDDKYGMFYHDDTSEDEVMIYTGSSDTTKTGIIENYISKNFPSDMFKESCQSVDGSDGSTFPPGLNRDSKVHIFDRLFCRLVPLTFEKDVTGNPASMRFTIPKDVFTPKEQNEETICYCGDTHPCDARGMFDISSCQEGYPMYVSFPHFYLANDTVRETVDGVTPPEKTKHEYFIDIEPTSGVTLKSRKRLQINLAMEKHKDFFQTGNIPDTIFPVAWFEEAYDVKTVPKYVKDLAKQSKPSMTSTTTTTTEPPKQQKPATTKPTEKSIANMTAQLSFAIAVLCGCHILTISRFI